MPNNHTVSLEDLRRFFAKVVQDPEKGCWLWQGYCDEKGYGQFRFKEKVVWAHRFIFECLVRQLKDNEDVHHKCAVPGCVNPAHLDAVTPQYNRQEQIHRHRMIKILLNTGQTLFPVEEITQEVVSKEIPF